MDRTTFFRVLIWIHLVPAGMLIVLQSPPSLVVTQGQLTKLGCFFPTESNRKGAVTWYKAPLDGNMTSAQVVPLRTRFSLAHPKTFLSEGDASLVIRNVTWEDAGIYFCNVCMWEKAEEQGPGTSLVVHALPSHPEIYLKISTMSQEDTVLTCRTSGFYPPDIAITWHSNDIDFPDPRPLEIWKSDRGNFHAARYLVLPSQFKTSLLTVSCIVRHISLPTPLYANYSHDPSQFGVSGYQLVEYLNVLKIALILGLTICILLTVKKEMQKQMRRIKIRHQFSTESYKSPSKMSPGSARTRNLVLSTSPCDFLLNLDLGLVHTTESPEFRLQETPSPH